MKEYTGTAYTEVNQAMRGERSLAGYQRTVDNINKFLDKAPIVYEGPVFRGVDAEGNGELHRKFSALAKGDSVNFGGSFLSTSSDSGRAAYFAGIGERAWMFKIENAVGAALEPISNVAFEYEVLMRPGHKFKVVSVYRPKTEGDFNVVTLRMVK